MGNVAKPFEDVAKEVGIAPKNNASPPRYEPSQYFFGEKNKEELLKGRANPYYKLKGELELVQDTSSRTADNLRGRATRSFCLVDSFNMKHIFNIQHGDSITTFFPCHGSSIRMNAQGIDNPGDQLRTGVGAEHNWCEVQFTNKGDCVRAEFNFFEDSKISKKCTDWDTFERMLNNVEKGVDILDKAADAYSKVKGGGAKK